MTEFSEKLEKLRIDRNMSKKDLANKSGLTPAYISQLTRGERTTPSEDVVNKVSKALNLDREARLNLLEIAGYSSTSFPDVMTLSSRNVTRREDLGEAPSAQVFHGRQKELATLKQWIMNQNCQLVMILGIGGIGKTALAAALTNQVKDQFEFVFWRSLHNAPPLEHFLQQCLQFLFLQPQPLPTRSNDLLPLLLHYLQAHRCLLVLDNFESLLQPGQNVGNYREGYEQYGRLFQLLGETEHQSCLLLTGREKLREIAHMEGQKSLVHTLPLAGVGTLEGKEILKDKGLLGSDTSWATLISIYSGNPLALKLVSEFIQDVFNGDIDRFLSENEEETVFGDINTLVDEQFHRLSVLERELLYWLAIEREPVTLETLREDLINPVTKGIFGESIASLRRRSMIEIRDIALFTLQPVIMEYITANLVRRACREFSREFDVDTSSVWVDFSFMKAQTKDYVRDNQARLILAIIADQLVTTSGKESIEQAINNALSALRHVYPRSRGYFAGNALNLLIHLKSNLRSYDFSHLTIRQAYLQNVYLPEVNFTQASFMASVFTNTFGNILSVAFNPDGTLLAAGTATGEIWIYQASTGKLLQTFKEHRDAVWSLHFHANGHILISGSDDQTLRIWDVHSGSCLKILKDHTNRVRSAVLSSDGKLLASGSDDQTVRLWDSHTGECLNVLSGHSDRIWSVAFSPDGRTLATGSTDRTIRLWDINKGICLKILQGHTSWVWSVTFSPDGWTLASASEDRTVRLWNVISGDCLKVLKGHHREVRSVCFNPQGDTLASASEDQTVRLWDVTSGDCLKVLEGHRSGVRSVAFHPDGDTLVSGGDDQAVRFWEVATGQGIKTLQGHTNRVWTAILSPDGQTLVSSHEGGTIRLWDTNTQNCFKTLQDQTHGVRATAFHPNGQILVSGGEDQTIRLWNTSTGEKIKTLRGHTKWIRSVACRPDGHMLASGGEDHTVRLWDSDTGQCLKCLEEHTNWVRCVTFSADGSLLASSSDDQTIRLWNPDTGRCLHILQGHTHRVRAAAFHPDGNRLASGSEDWTVRLWNRETGQCLHVLQGHTNRVLSVAFSPCGELLASSSDDQTIRLWESNTGQCLNVLQGHTQRIRWVTFAPPGSPLVSCSDDGTIKLWDIKDKPEVEATCIHTLISGRPYEGMNITKAQGLTDAQKLSLLALGAVDDGVS